ncbi:hypothetical protein FN846DRAFT_891640 [Sphaerosporella brunnea]|uniref:Uncharacterized protein n=1 Tax=Sphaerosporella brunnea TaxID=1250544 RepID=A0A5J5ESN3_9PEZI|nr:hypothetical protein FN846DRAFT_891640 [Sphaerosporella brunnea]
MPPAAKRPRHVGGSRRRDPATSSPGPDQDPATLSPGPHQDEDRQATPADKPATADKPVALIYKDYPALCALIGIGVNDKVTMLQIRTRILEQCQALGVPLDQNYRSYPPETMTPLVDNVTTWWNTNYGRTERYLSLGVVDSIIHRLCLDKVRNARAKGRRERGRAETGNAYRDPSAYQKYPGREHTAATEQDASPDEHDDTGGQIQKSTVVSEMEVPLRDSVTPPGFIDDSFPAGSGSAMNDPSEIIPTPPGFIDDSFPAGSASAMNDPSEIIPTPPGFIDDSFPAGSASAMNDPPEISRTAPPPPRPDSSPPVASISAPQSDLDSSTGGSVTPSRSVRHDVPGDPGSVSNVEPASATIPEFGKVRVPPTPAEEIRSDSELSAGVFPSQSKSIDNEVPDEAPSGSNVTPETCPSQDISKLWGSTSPAAPVAPQLSQLNVYQPQPQATPVAGLATAAPSAPPVAHLTTAAPSAPPVAPSAPPVAPSAPPVAPSAPPVAPSAPPVASGGSANSITLTGPNIPDRLTIPRSCSLMWLVSRLAKYFHNPAGGFTLGALLRSPQLRMKKLTTEAEWRTIVTDPQITELTITASICEKPPVGEDGIQAYVGSEEEIVVLPRRAPLWWIVSRVAEWYWGAGDGYSINVMLADYDLTQVNLDCEETWVRVASDPKVRTIIVSISQAITGAE